jgi:hypothetical protein
VTDLVEMTLAARIVGMATDLQCEIETSLAGDLAVYSGGALFRYILMRAGADRGRRVLGATLLNPSTASAFVDDPTIRRVRSFAARENFGTILIGNMFAFRSTDPKNLRAVASIGKHNDAWLQFIAAHSDTVLCGWGVNKLAQTRAATVVPLLREHCANLVCLGTSKSGAPNHPLYLAADTPLVPFAHKKRAA